MLKELERINVFDFPRLCLDNRNFKRTIYIFNHIQRLLKEVVILGKRKDRTYWNIPVPMILNAAVEKAILMDMHVTKSDFVRDAVRQKLERMGFESKPFQEHDSKDEGKVVADPLVVNGRQK